MSTQTGTSRPSFSFSPRLALLAAAALVLLLILLLLLSPAERQLGDLIKIIYLHGALARSGMFGLMASGILGLLYLIRPLPGLLSWSNAIQVAGMALFVLHFLLSMIPTHETWGVWIAFDEPRTAMSLQIMGVGILVIVVRYLLGNARLSALTNLLLGAAVGLLSARTGVLRHPLNPIGESPSASIQLFYVGILATCLALMVLLAWAIVAWTGRPLTPKG